MKRILFGFLIALGCLLFLWGCTTLIEAPPSDAPTADPRPVVHAMLAPDLRAAQESRSDTRPDRPVREDDCVSIRQQTVPPTMPIRDRNGTPMRREKYIRAVYQAFPHERMPG